MQSFSNLVEAETVLSHLCSPDWRLFDCRFDLKDVSAGEAAYAANHIPGAQYLHLDRDLSSPRAAGTGRHPLPQPARLAQRLGELGLGPDSQAVFYDDSAGLYAARAWWLLRQLGHQRAAVLNGGLAAWRAAGGELTARREQPEPRELPCPIGRFPSLSAGDVQAGLAAGNLALVDVRSDERFRGLVEPLDPVAGHVPGASNLPHTTLLGADGRFLPPERIRERLIAHLSPVGPQPVAVMCGSGVTACHVLLAMDVAGLHGASLYGGSWSEWCSDPSRPVATAMV